MWCVLLSWLLSWVAAAARKKALPTIQEGQVEAAAAPLE
jgi:hypothetical protein